MPILEPPTRRDPSTDVPSSSKPYKFTTRRFGDIEEHELLHLLDTIDDEISRARFRESVYVSIIICLAFAWLAVYGPRFLFHPARIANPPSDIAKLNKELPYIDLPPNLVHKPPPRSRISDQDRTAQTQHPIPRVEPVHPPPGAPGARTPLPQAPQPQQPRAASNPQPQAPAPQPPPPQRTAQPSQLSSIPDAPRPTNPHPTFPGAQSPGQSNRAAADSALRGTGGNYGIGNPSRNGPQGNVEILSDTQGVDFGNYIKRLLRILYNSWVPLIPEETRPPLNKEGTTLIRFTINADGTLSYMHLDASTHDTAIDRAAWGSITGVGQFPPLPKEFKGPNLQLRINFIITHNAPPNDF